MVVFWYKNITGKQKVWEPATLLMVSIVLVMW